MKHGIAFPLPACLFLSCSLAAQGDAPNLLANGDFQASGSTIAPWTLVHAGDALRPRVHETNGNRTFRAGIVNRKDAWIALEHAFVVDSERGAQQGLWLCSLGGEHGYTFHSKIYRRTALGLEPVQGTDLFPNPSDSRACCRNLRTPPGAVLTPGSYIFRLTCQRAITTPSVVDIEVDDVAVRLVRYPAVFAWQRTEVGVELAAQLSRVLNYGLLFAAPDLRASGLPLPGIGGDLWLDIRKAPPVLVWNGSGNTRRAFYRFDLIQCCAPRILYLQGLEFDLTARTQQLGSPVRVRLY